MKRIFDLLTVLIILIATLSPFWVNIYAQNNSDVTTQTNKKTEDQEVEQTEERKLEEQELRKFVDDFFVAFNETRDLKQVPDSFFISDFKSRFAKNKKWFELYKDRDSTIQLSDEERYEYNILMANFTSLISISFIGNFNGNLDEYSDDAIYKLLPSQIVKKMKKSRWFRHTLDTDADFFSV
jgi:hypothetical protein